jgi:hypothetical protein
MSGSLLRLTFCLFSAVFLTSACGSSKQLAAPESPRSTPAEGFWKHWGDGNAELSGYRLSQPRYGEMRTGEAILITVTEEFTRAGRVKTDGGHFDEFGVLKLNEMRRWQTGIYDYNVMTSTFLPLDGSLRRGLPTKVSFSSQEWCGHIWEQLRIDDSAAGRTLHSYFDGEADHYESLPIPEGGYFADSMPLVTRGLVGDILQPGESTEVPWMRSTLNRRLLHEPTLWGKATLRRGLTSQKITVPAGEFEVEKWTAKDAKTETSWFIEADAPRRLIAWEVSDGERGELTGSLRTRYWSQNAPGDEALRAQLGLPRDAAATSINALEISREVDASDGPPVHPNP